jgi:hypothetical protein
LNFGIGNGFRGRSIVNGIERRQIMLVPKKLGFVLSALLVAMLTLPVLGQANNGGGGDNGNGGGNGNGNNGGGGGGGGGGFGGRRDPAQFMQRMMDGLKTQLGASDDEFAAIQPKIQAVMTLQRDVITRPRMFGRGGPGGGGGGRGGFGGGGFGGPTTQPSAVQTALQDLQTALDDQNTSPDDIKTKLDTLRQAKSKARQDLVVAQQDLKSILTQRQEAVMVLDGYLD